MEEETDFMYNFKFIPLVLTSVLRVRLGPKV